MVCDMISAVDATISFGVVRGYDETSDADPGQPARTLPPRGSSAGGGVPGLGRQVESGGLRANRYQSSARGGTRLFTDGSGAPACMGTGQWPDSKRYGTGPSVPQSRVHQRDAFGAGDSPRKCDARTGAGGVRHSVAGAAGFGTRCLQDALRERAYAHGRQYIHRPQRLPRLQGLPARSGPENARPAQS